MLLAVAPPTMPRLNGVSIDPMVFSFAILASLVASLVFGLVPAFRASNPNLVDVLRSGGRGATSGRGARLRHGVVVAEVALSFVLLVGAGLMIRSFRALGRIAPGFDTRNMMTFYAANPRLRSGDAARAFVDQLDARLHAIPGVIDVTASSLLPLDGLDGSVRWGPMESTSDQSKYRTGSGYIVQPSFFGAMGTKIIAGRAFEAADNIRGSNAVIVDDLLARRTFPNERLDQVIGKQVLLRINLPEAEPVQIVGIVQHQMQLSLEDTREALYRPAGAFAGYATPRWAVRTSADPTLMMNEIRRAIADVDPLMPISDVRSMTENVSRAMAPTRFSLMLVTVFGGVAAILAAIGLYGVVSTSVRERRGEIGIRLALGASQSSVLHLVLKLGLTLSALGMVAGVFAALVLTRLLASAGMLVSVKATDPITYAAIAVFFTAVAVLACWIPARAGARVDPNVALRATA